MQPKLLLAGVLLAAMAAALPGQAYHVERAAVHQRGVDPQEWAFSTLEWPVGDPLVNSQEPCATVNGLQPIAQRIDEIIDDNCKDEPLWEQGDGIVAASRCEQPGDPGVSGVGVLCFMSPGFAGTATCAFDASAQGKSTGWQDPYDGGACVHAGSAPAWPPTSPAWFQVTMEDNHPGTVAGRVPFLGAIAGLGCDVPSTILVYDDQFAQLVAAGHVTGYPQQPTAPAAFGSYTITQVAGPGPGSTQCGNLPIHIA